MVRGIATHRFKIGRIGKAATPVLALLAAVLWATGCGGAGHAPAVSTPAAEVIETSNAAPITTDPAFAAGAAILNGFDLGDSVDQWRAGDRVLLGLRTSKRGKEVVRFLLIELTDRENTQEPVSFSASPKRRRKFEFSSTAIETKLSLYDRDGALMQSSTGRFPKGLLGFGLIDGVQSSLDRPEMRGREDLTEGLSDEEYDRTMRGWMTLFSFSGAMGKRGIFRDMLHDVVARPTWLALLLNPSVSLGYGQDWPRRSEDRWIGQVQVPTVVVPMECTIAGKKAAVAAVTAARPVAPLGLCGGVVEVSVANGEDAAITMDIRLLAALRGDPVCPPDPD
ncbi:MAG: hypothetical protein ACK4WH_02425 [Phycisphaerales bacterium]